MRAFFVAAALLGSALAWSAQTPAPDPVLRAMHDELERSRKLSISTLEAPYFIEYVLDEAENFSVTATLGGVVARRRERIRQPEVHVRVGDYKFDNGNYAGAGAATRYDFGRFPLDDSYAVLRRGLWLRTDAAYKTALEAISRKRAAMRNMSQGEQVDDFARSEPVRYLRDLRRLTLDEDAWTNRVRALSAIFTEYPEIQWSGVEMESSEGGYYVVNTEGTEVRAPEGATFVRIRANTQAADGMALRDAVTFVSADAARLPGDPELTAAAHGLAKNVTALAHAPKGEDYTGPVLFEGVAGAQLMAEVLGRNLALPRRPVTDGPRGAAGFITSELEGRIGARVLPESFDVVDDPTQKEWRGRPLFGSYDVDREGVAARPLPLIQKGVLKGYLATRQPVRGFEGSNGRARMPGNFSAATPDFGNLFVSSSDAVPASELKKKLIELCRTRNKPYGVIVRKMDYPSTGSFNEARRLLAAAQGGRPVSMPVLVYRLYQDGREELVRGLRFRGLTVRSLKDILAAGDDLTAFEFLDNAAPFALVGVSSYTTEVSVVAPSLLVDDLELHPAEEELPRVPVAPPPDFEP